MRHIRKLTDDFRGRQHPGCRLGEEILRHSCCSEYLVGVLSAFLQAAKQDLEQEIRTRNHIIKLMQSERDES